jgi:hypothetical protein
MLVTILLHNAISEIGNEALRNGYVGRIAGIDVFENANIGY